MSGFRIVEELQTARISVELCEPDPDTMIMIVEAAEHGDDEFLVFPEAGHMVCLGFEEAVALRDWLNRAIPNG